MAQGPSSADLTQALSGMQYPAGKDALKKHAKSNGAPDEVVSAIENLPEGEFGTMADVTKAFGQEDKSKISGSEHQEATEAARRGGSQ
jgi:hypothetical protein